MKKQFISFVLLHVYCFLLVEVLVLKQLPVIRIEQMMFNFGGTQDGPANLIPFKTILPYLLGKNGALIAAINIVGNILALVPLGFMVPFVYSKIDWKKIVLLAVIAGLMIEITQVILHIGIFDIDDVILNALGVIIGFWLFKLFSKFSAPIKKTIITVILLISGLLLIFLTLSYFKKIIFPIGIESSDNAMLMPLMNNDSSNKAGDCCDLCNGTGGTGQIIAKGENTITIKGRKGTEEVINLNAKTVIKNSNEVIKAFDLKIGDRVTVIIDETETASLILVCGIAPKQ
jgi:glycopeptide antibiotics resistance protein